MSRKKRVFYLAEINMFVFNVSLSSIKKKKIYEKEKNKNVETNGLM